MSHTVVIGAGPIGTETALQLVARGDEVTVITRHGTAVAGARAAAVDVLDTAALTAALDEATTAFVAINWPYQHWGRNWPLATSALIAAATATQSRIVLTGNLYGYGIDSSPFTEATPLKPPTRLGEIRATAWKMLQDATEAGAIQATEVRASDYFGPKVRDTAHLGERFFRPLLHGNTATVIGDPDALHSWSYVPDIAATLIAASVTDDAWGKPWLVPNSTPFSLNTIASQITLSTARRGSVRQIHPATLALGAIGSPLLRNIRKLRDQFTHPFVTDASLTSATLGVSPTPWSTALEATISYWQAELDTL